MRIMTSNIWGNFFNNPPELRENQLLKAYEKYDPDVIGFQETAAGWYDVELFKDLSRNYNLIGTECFNNTNSTPIVIKKDYTVVAYGHEQLARTPDLSKSITWAVAEKEGKRFAVCNTHFWWMRGTESEAAKKANGVLDFTPDDHNELRALNAKQLSQLMLELQKKFGCVVFGFGDMNSTISEKVFDLYLEFGIQHLYDAAEEKSSVCSIHGDPVRGSDGLFHGKRATDEYIEWFRSMLLLPPAPDKEGRFSSIDHIIGLGNGFKVLKYQVVEDQDALDATDHSPVFADIILE